MKRSVRFLAVLALLATFVLGAAPASSASATVMRPISDFLVSQGTFCPPGVPDCLFVPPEPNLLGWETALAATPVRFSLVDYAGLWDVYAPGKKPQMSGTITERPLPDGRAEVTVRLYTKNAAAWVCNLDPNGDFLTQINENPTVFGERATAQALANSFLQVIFINSAPGAPLPDLVQLAGYTSTLPGVEVRFLAFNSQATGPLYPGGTPGKSIINQKGLVGVYNMFFNKLPGSPSRVFLDGFPAERISVTPIGH